MTTIYKYPFPVTDSFSLMLPRGFQVLSVAMQAGTPCLWAWVNPAASLESIRFRIFGTGHEISNRLSLEHVATFQDGPGVWHLFRDRTP